jgi:hypothetical protein
MSQGWAVEKMKVERPAASAKGRGFGAVAHSPLKPKPGLSGPPAEIRNSEATNILTRVVSVCSVGDVIRFADVRKRLEQQFHEDEKYLRRNYAEQNKLRPTVLRFHDLEREARARELRLQRIAALVGDEHFADTRRDLLSGIDVSKEIQFDDVEVPLWLAMKAIVEQVSEIQVIDLQNTLAYFGRKCTRQAVESALAAHKETFDTEVRSREKFVSLKR